MKKFIVIAVILMCFLVYAIVKLSMSEYQNKSQNQKAYKQAEETQSAKQINADNTDKATPEEDSGSAVPATAAQVEAVTKALTEFQSCLKDGEYEQAWELTSEYFKQRACNGSFEKFKEVCDRIGLATATVHLESSVVMDDGVGLLVTSPSFIEDLYFLFVEEDGQWKLNIGKEAGDVPR